MPPARRNHLGELLWIICLGPTPNVWGWGLGLRTTALAHPRRPPSLSSRQLYQCISLFNQQALQTEIVSCGVKKGQKCYETQSNTEAPVPQRAQHQGTVAAHATQKSESSHGPDQGHPRTFTRTSTKTTSQIKRGPQGDPLFPSFPLDEYPDC